MPCRITFFLLSVENKWRLVKHTNQLKKKSTGNGKRETDCILNEIKDCITREFYLPCKVGNKQLEKNWMKISILKTVFQVKKRIEMVTVALCSFWGPVLILVWSLGGYVWVSPAEGEMDYQPFLLLKTSDQIKVRTQANTSLNIPTLFYNIKCTQKGEGARQREREWDTVSRRWIQ